MKSLPFVLTLAIFVLSQVFAKAQPQWTNINGFTYLIPKGGPGASPPATTTPPATTVPPATTTNKPPTNAAFTNTTGYAVFVSTKNMTAGGTVNVTWNYPNPFTTQLDKVELYRLEGSNWVVVGSRFITLSGHEVFTITTSGIYQVYYIGYFSGGIKAKSSLIFVGEQPPVSVPGVQFTLSVEKAGNSVLLSWFAQTNYTYNLFFVNSLGTTNWLDTAEIRGAGTRTNFLIPKQGLNGFYRLSVR